MRTNPGIDEIIGQLGLFASCDRRQLARISELATTIGVAPGTVVCREGRPGREAFVLLSGEVEVTIGGRSLASLGAGSFFGETALLDGGARTATVVARTPLEVLVFNPAEFDAMLKEIPQIGRRILTAVESRLRFADAALAPAAS